MTSGNPQSELVVRPIAPNDAEAAAGLALQLGYARPAAAVRAWIESLTTATNQAAFVACLGSQVVGWIEVSTQRHLQSEPYALINGLVVREGLRGQGIGRLLCLRGEQWSLDQGVCRMRVTSRSTREEAHRFYLEAGFRETKTSLVFEKTLPVKDK